MIHKEKQRDWGEKRPRKEKRKHLRSDRSARKQLSENILTIPLQSCSRLYYNTHVHARRLSEIQNKTPTETQQWDKLGEASLPRCWRQVGQITFKKKKKKTLLTP